MRLREMIKKSYLEVEQGFRKGLCFLFESIVSFGTK